MATKCRPASTGHAVSMKIVFHLCTTGIASWLTPRLPFFLPVQSPYWQACTGKPKVANLPRTAAKCRTTLHPQENGIDTAVATVSVCYVDDCKAHVAVSLFSFYADSAGSAFLAIPVSPRAHKLVLSVSYSQISAVLCEWTRHCQPLHVLATTIVITVIFMYVASCGPVSSL